MVRKFVLEGWITARLAYSPSTRFFTDLNEFYFANHTGFDFGDDNRSRIKCFDFTDEDEDVSYSATFGYDRIGIRFTIATQEETAKDRISILRSSLSKAIKGYKNFKKHFLSKKCPESVKIEFNERSEKLLIVLFGFFDGLSTKQQNNLLRKIKTLLREYTSDVQFLLTNEEMTDYSDKQEIRALTLRELEELTRFDFCTIFIVCGEIYLYVNHHLFARYFILEDPSLGLVTVARWGLISSLNLLNLHYIIKAFDKEIEDLRSKLKEMNKKVIPSGLNAQTEKLIQLEKERISIENDLREFTKLSHEIYIGLNRSEHSMKILDTMNAMESLPHSLYHAHGILTMQKLGRLSGFRESLESLNSERKMLEMKFKKREACLTLLVLTVVSVALYSAGLEIGYLADILQILTFGVAIVLLLVRFWPSRPA
jgi:hypothetical protein